MIGKHKLVSQKAIQNQLADCSSTTLKFTLFLRVSAVDCMVTTAMIVASNMAGLAILVCCVHIKGTQWSNKTCLSGEVSTEYNGKWQHVCEGTR